MSFHGHPQQIGSTPYPPQNTSSPYPQQSGNAAYSQQGANAPGPQQGGSVPYSQPGANAPYPQQGGKAPYPQQSGSVPFPQQGGSAPYPQQVGSAPYPQQVGSAPYPQQVVSAPYPQQGGSTPYPQQGAGTQYAQQGGNSPYSQQGGATAYPQQGRSAPYPQQGVGMQYPQQDGSFGYPQQGGGLSYPQQGGGTQYPQQGGGTPYPQQDAYAQQGGGTQYSQQPGGSSSTKHFPQQVPPQGNQYGQPHQGSPYGTQGPPQGHQYGQFPPGQEAPQRSQYGQTPQTNYGQGADSQSQGRLAVNPGQEQFATKVELRLECRNLLNKDVLSKSDPCAVLYMDRKGRWEEVGRTENVINCLDPRFSRSFTVSYYFEEVQKLQIAVYDLDNTTPELSDDDFLGYIETTLGQLVSSSPYSRPLLLRNGRKAGNGVITVRAEEIKEGTETVSMTFHAKKLEKKDFLGKSDPYLEVQRATMDGSWQVVHRTEVIKNNLNPSWRPFELPMHTLCGGNKKQNIKFDVYDWDSDGSHDYIGGFTASLEEMLQASQHEVSWPCINPSKKAKKKSYTNSGIVLLSSCKLLKTHTFLDYIFGGLQINFTVGIDFTGSNGNPSHPTSLHYINPHQPNEYMQAIRAVGDVCQDYDTDKLFPALGFGAKIPPNPQVMHEFAINFNPQNPYCAGIDGVLQAYYNCIQRVQLYGPTNAAPIINHVANFAAAAQREEPQKGAHAYYILLMLTDGVLSDMSNTKFSIVKASRLPMSLIIVGVGNADFTDMNELDGDSGVLRAPNGEPVKRDIVQFVPFRDFKRSSSVELARCVLAEVPKQVTDYYKMRGMQPNKAHTDPSAA